MKCKGSQAEIGANTTVCREIRLPPEQSATPQGARTLLLFYLKGSVKLLFSFLFPCSLEGTLCRVCEVVLCVIMRADKILKLKNSTELAPGRCSGRIGASTPVFLTRLHFNFR